MAADGGSALRMDDWRLRQGDDFVTAYKQKRDRFFRALEAKGLRRICEIAYCQYYGLNPNIGDMETQTLAFVGENNEFLRFRINQFRSFIKQQLSMLLRERAAFKAVGVNTDYSTLAQIQSSDQTISYLYQTGTGAGELERQVAEANAVIGIGGAHIQWDYDGGDDMDVELPHPDGHMIPQQDQGGYIEMVPATITTQKRSGMPTASMLQLWEMPCDPDVRGSNHAWRSAREKTCKHDLAADYPELAEELQTMQLERDSYSAHALFGFDVSGNEDDIMVDHVYVARCKSLPRGRYVGIAQDLILWDEDLPIDEIPIEEMCSERWMGTSFAYCSNWDLIAPQEMRDQLCSDAASNYTKFGRPMIVSDEGLMLDQNLVARGHYIWTKPPKTDFPQATKIDPMPPGFFEFLGYLHAQDQAVTQQNSVTRGDPDKNITSGEMAALFHSQAYEFRNAEQAALHSFRKGTANKFLAFTMRYAEAPFLAEVSGASERPYLKEVKKESLSGIKRVIIEPVSALSQSTSGRLTMANVLMKIEDPKMRAALQKGIETGQWGDFCKKDRNSDMRVQWENEHLAQGIPCSVLATDNPFEHLPGHLADIDARTEQLNGNPIAAQAYLEHVMEHLMQYQMLNPNLARTLNIPLPLPIQGTPTGQANLMLTGPVEPVPQSGGAPMDAIEDAAKTSAPMQAQGRDTSGVKLPKPSSPPKSSSATPQAAGAAA